MKKKTNQDTEKGNEKKKLSLLDSFHDASGELEIFGFDLLIESSVVRTARPAACEAL